MSSSYVRTNIKSYFAAQFPGEVLVDFTADERDLRDVLQANGLTANSEWYGIQFIGSSEIPIAIASAINTGCYREEGVLQFHVVVPSKLNAGDDIVANAETIRDKFRGARINDIVIRSVDPVNTEAGAALQFEAGFTGGTFAVEYYRDINL